MERLYRLPQVIEVTGLGRSSIYRLAKEGRFPPSVRIGDRAVAWRASEIEEWIKTRQVAIEARNVRGLAQQILSGV